jgi:hypothetical protein
MASTLLLDWHPANPMAVLAIMASTSMRFVFITPPQSVEQNFLFCEVKRASPRFFPV